jgi:hypothetical protein
MIYSVCLSCHVVFPVLVLLVVGKCPILLIIMLVESLKTRAGTYRIIL